MSQNRAAYLFAALGLIGLVISAFSGAKGEQPDPEGPNARIAYCGFEIPEAIKRGNASFYLIYRFRVGGEGVPEAIELLKSRFVSEEAVSSCLASWQFPPRYSGKELTVVQFWKHGVGWEKLVVDGIDPGLELRLFGDAAPYKR